MARMEFDDTVEALIRQGPTKLVEVLTVINNFKPGSENLHKRARITNSQIGVDAVWSFAMHLNVPNADGTSVYQAAYTLPENYGSYIRIKELMGAAYDQSVVAGGLTINLDILRASTGVQTTEFSIDLSGVAVGVVVRDTSAASSNQLRPGDTLIITADCTGGTDTLDPGYVCVKGITEPIP